MADFQKAITKELVYHCFNLFCLRRLIQDKILENVNIIQRNERYIKRKIKYSGSVVSFVFAALFLVGGLLLFIFKDYFVSLTERYQTETNITLLFASGIIWTISLAFIIIAALLLVRTKHRKKEFSILKQQAIDANAQLSQNIATQQESIANIENELFSYDLIHTNYWYAGDIILNYIILGRAATVMDAINLFEHECQVNIQLQQNLQIIQASEKIHNQLVVNGVLSVMNTAAVVGSVNSAATRVSSAVNNLRY